jgi:hypothetical protein
VGPTARSVSLPPGHQPRATTAQGGAQAQRPHHASPLKQVKANPGSEASDRGEWKELDSSNRLPPDREEEEPPQEEIQVSTSQCRSLLPLSILPVGRDSCPRFGCLYNGFVIRVRICPSLDLYIYRVVGRRRGKREREV